MSSFDIDFSHDENGRTWMKGSYRIENIDDLEGFIFTLQTIKPLLRLRREMIDNDEADPDPNDQ